MPLSLFIALTIDQSHNNSSSMAQIHKNKVDEVLANWLLASSVAGY